MIPGSRVFVDGRRARVLAWFAEGSTSYAFPHARVVFVDRAGDDSDPTVIAVKRISTDPLSPATVGEIRSRARADLHRAR